MTTVNTLDLQVGDVVLTHGMRVRLDGNPREWDYRDGRGPTRAFTGLVLADEVIAERIVSKNWLYEDSIGQPSREPRWIIQGNWLALWTIEGAR